MSVKPITKNTKRCATCDREVAREDFRRNRRCADDRVAHCKACELETTEKRKRRQRLAAARARMQREETLAELHQAEERRQAEADAVNARAFARLRADRESRGA